VRGRQLGHRRNLMSRIGSVTLRAASTEKQTGRSSARSNAANDAASAVRRELGDASRSHAHWRSGTKKAAQAPPKNSEGIGGQHIFFSSLRPPWPRGRRCYPLLCQRWHGSQAARGLAIV